MGEKGKEIETLNLELLQWTPLAFLGVAIGIIGSITGAGGGFLLAPVLLLLYKDETVAVINSISLAVVFLNAASASIAFARLRRIDIPNGAIFATASVPSGVLGAFATLFVPRGIFDAGFGFFLIVAAAYLGFRARSPEGQGIPTHIQVPKGAALSAAIGFLSSFLGIGGGFILVPMLTSILEYPVPIATATSQFVLTFMALSGTITHVLSGQFEHGIRRTLAIGIGVLIGAQVGARLSGRVPGSWVLKALAVGLAVVGTRLVLTAITT